MGASSVQLTRLDRLIAGVGRAAAELRRVAGLRAGNGRHGFAVRHYRDEERRLLESISPTALLRLVA
jgi:hypothetical protein